MEYFAMTPELAEEFFNRCLYKEAITEKERLEVMRELIAEKKQILAGQTNLSKDEFVKQLSSKGANVMMVKGRDRKPKGLNPDFKREENEDGE